MLIKWFVWKEKFYSNQAIISHGKTQEQKDPIFQTGSKPEIFCLSSTLKAITAIQLLMSKSYIILPNFFVCVILALS